MLIILVAIINTETLCTVNPYKYSYNDSVYLTKFLSPDFSLTFFPFLFSSHSHVQNKQAAPCFLLPSSFLTHSHTHIHTHTHKLHKHILMYYSLVFSNSTEKITHFINSTLLFLKLLSFRPIALIWSVVIWACKDMFTILHT